MRGLAILVGLAVFIGAAGAATVTARNGNILVDGKPITSSGHDIDPVLSPDGKRIVFERLSGGPALNDCASEATETKAIELWSINADGSGAKRLLALHSDPDVGRTLCAFDDVQFSSNGRFLYFHTPAWATSGAIHVYDFKTGSERLFLPGDGLKILAGCKNAKYRDDVIVEQHRYFVFGGSYDWSFLFTPAGKEVGPLGDGDYSSQIADVCG